MPLALVLARAILVKLTKMTSKEIAWRQDQILSLKLLLLMMKMEMLILSSTVVVSVQHDGKVSVKK